MVGKTGGKGDVSSPVLHKEIINEISDNLSEARRTVGNEFVTLSLKAGEGESSADRVSDDFLRHLGFLAPGSTIDELMTHLPTVQELRERYGEDAWKTRAYRDGSDAGKWASISSLGSETLPGVKAKVTKKTILKEQPADYDVIFFFDPTALQKSVTPKIVSS